MSAAPHHGPTLLALSHRFALVHAEEIPSRGYTVYTAGEVEVKHTVGVSNLLEKWSWVLDHNQYIGKLWHVALDQWFSRPVG